jgi:hypothetical protein
MKTWLAKEDLKKTGKKIWKRFFWIFVLCCFWRSIYSLVPYYWSVKVQDYFDMVRQNVKRWYTYDKIVSESINPNMGGNFNYLTDWEDISFDTWYFIDENTADFAFENWYAKMFRYMFKTNTALEISISWCSWYFTVANMWLNDHGIYDIPEYQFMGSQSLSWEESCYLLRPYYPKWYWSERDFDLLEWENPHNCIIWNMTPQNMKGSTYIRFFQKIKSNKIWYVEFHERPILRTHY